MISQWIEAKRTKDFVTADRLRKELRDQGIDPDGTRANVETGFNRNPGRDNPWWTETRPGDWRCPECGSQWTCMGDVYCRIDPQDLQENL